jgi:hypothetical protein
VIAAAPAAAVASPIPAAPAVSLPVKARAEAGGSPDPVEVLPRTARPLTDPPPLDGGGPDAADAESIETTVTTGTSHAAPATPAAPLKAVRRLNIPASSPCVMSLRPSLRRPCDDIHGYVTTCQFTTLLVHDLCSSTTLRPLRAQPAPCCSWLHAAGRPCRPTGVREVARRPPRPSPSTRLGPAERSMPRQRPASPRAESYDGSPILGKTDLTRSWRSSPASGDTTMLFPANG